MLIIRIFLLLFFCVGIVRAQEWRILALRVDFPLEDPDESTTTGRGHFDLRPFEEAKEDYSLPYDIPPHNRAYFENHLEALRRYYEVVSEGRVAIDYEVFPRAVDAAYTLPESMLHYGNGRSTEEIGDKWIELLRDALELALADAQGPDLTQFNSFLFFHAGVGFETGQFNDIRSVFLEKEDFARFAGGPLDIGGVQIDQAWILPESPSQRGRGGLNGLMAKFFGNQLGLPGLSNFADGLPAVGSWSLMDVGANALGFVRRDSLDAVVGFAPPHPMAWSKVELGWVEPLVVRRDTVVSVLASDRSGDLPRVVRVPIDVDEYYLIENRQQRGQRGAPAGMEVIGADPDEVVWIDEGAITFSGEGRGVWLGVEEYDVFVPGSGILIWHIDAGVIDSSEAGAINNDPVYQGIALEEADGYRDIGNPVFERLRQIEGSPDDAFFVGGQTLFSDITKPDTRSNEGWQTGIEIEVLSEPGDVMQVAIRFGRSAVGWPVEIKGGRRLQAVDVDGDGEVELLVESEDGLYYAESGAGLSLWVEGARFLAAGDADGDGAAEVFVRRGNNVEAWAVGATDPLWQQNIGGRIDAVVFSSTSDFSNAPALILIVDGILKAYSSAEGILLTEENVPEDIVALFADGDGRAGLVRQSALASMAGERPLPVLAGDMDGDGQLDLMVAGDQGSVTFPDGLSVVLGDSLVAAPALGDIDGDGLLEGVFLGTRAIYVLRANGLAQENFPAMLPRFAETGPLAFEPVLGDVDGDGRQEIVIGAYSGVFALGEDGRLVPGFPLLTAAPVVYSPVLADFDGDGELEIAALDAEALYVWDIGRLDPAYVGRDAQWSQAGRDAASTRFLSVITTSEPNGELALLPGDRAYCYPNPVSGDDLAHVRFYLRAAASIELTIFDALGAQVERLELNGHAGTNEIAWPINEYDSGLYLCRLEAKGAASKGEVLIKMAVSR